MDNGLLCNGVDDCGDGSDESLIHARCSGKSAGLRVGLRVGLSGAVNVWTMGYIAMGWTTAVKDPRQMQL